MAVAVDLSSTGVRINWGFNWWMLYDEQVEGLRIYQGTTSLEAEVGTSERSAVTPASRGNRKPGAQHKYHFDVRAFNAVGESPVDACSVNVTTNP